MASLTLWLFVLGLGVDLGAGLYEARVVIPLWAGGVPATLAAGNPYAQVAINAGLNFWAYVTSAVALLAILALVVGLKTPPTQRAWRTVAVVVELCVVAATLLYFRPTLVRLFMGHGAGMTPAEISSTVGRWVVLSRVRIVASVVAWCAALRALQLS